MTTLSGIFHRADPFEYGGGAESGVRLSEDDCEGSSVRNAFPILESRLMFTRPSSAGCQIEGLETGVTKIESDRLTTRCLPVASMLLRTSVSKAAVSYRGGKVPSLSLSSLIPDVEAAGCTALLTTL
jgi:hypothetical protein